MKSQATKIMLSIFSLTVAITATAQQDFSTEMHTVTFKAWPNSRVPYRNLDGSGIGYSNSGVTFSVTVDGNTYRQSMVNGQVDTATLLSKVQELKPQQTEDGHTFISMQVMQDVKEDNGYMIPKGTPVLLDSADLYISKNLQPTSGQSVDEVPSSPAATADQNFNTNLTEGGVTAATRPKALDPQQADDNTDDVVTNGADDVDEDDLYRSSGRIVLERFGRQFRHAFLSPPVCNCVGSRCIMMDDFGPRNRFRTRNGRWSSAFHKGIDIAAPAQRRKGKLVTTTVVAAAPGCLVMPASAKGKYKPGDKFPLSLLKEGGAGYTIHLSHGNGIETSYSHLSSISLASLRAFQCFDRGVRIGSMGLTGNTTGYHLHFGVSMSNNGHRVPVNPASFFALSSPLRKKTRESAAYLSPSCGTFEKYSGIDKEMYDALHGNGTSSNPAALVRSSSGRQ